MSSQMLSVTAITEDADCQPRIAIDPRVVEDYADDMTEGAGFPPLTVYHDGYTYWLADGFHRLAAAKRLGLAEIACDVRSGDKRAAVLHSCGANAVHGMRRTNADKGRAVGALLNDPDWSQWSNEEIARRCGVSHTFVSIKRSSLATVASDRTYTDRYGNVRTMDTSNIGKSAPAPKPLTPLPPMPAHIPAELVDDFFPEAEEYEPLELAPAVDWTDRDAEVFVRVVAALSALDADPKRVAYAALATNQTNAKLFQKRAQSFAAWLGNVAVELQRIGG